MRIRALLIEDSESDARLLRRELARKVREVLGAPVG